MLYNPETRKPINLLTDVKDVTDDTFAKFHRKRAVANKEEAMQLNICGHVYWFEDARIMRGYLVPARHWQPIDDSGVHVPGINWGDQYFRTKEGALRFRESIVDGEHYQVGWPTHHEDGDVWSIHYHY